MKQTPKEMIAKLVKEGRMTKGYTQKELSELSNISIRSIQRIENGEILPRSYTLKTLAGILDQPFEQFAKILQHPPLMLEQSIDEEATTTLSESTINRKQRIILSLGLCMAIFFLAWAYTAQSATFPETTFELLIFSVFVLLIITGTLFLLWRNK